MQKTLWILLILFNFSNQLSAQTRWQKVDSLFGPLPSSVHVYRSLDSIEGKPSVAFYLEADLNDRTLYFETDTAKGRRLTPSQFYSKGYDSMVFKDQAHIFPLLVVNTTFFSFATNQNLNTVIQANKLVSYNIHSLPARGKDTLTFRHPLPSAIGISKSRKPDVAWLYTDSSRRYAYATQKPLPVYRDSMNHLSFRNLKKKLKSDLEDAKLKKWKMHTAVGGGPVLLQDGQIQITNNEEYRFAGKAIDDRHPRTAMGYTRDNKLIVLVVEGRNAGKAEGASLKHLAHLLKEIGCVEALNLDGGGSSCMLINGKTTIRPSDREAQQRPIPAVFTIKKK
jgi:hypothetical protein